ncbi:hypothetical protein F383_15667 [Gossypium arboreum]|uniref:Uncharacterized protein n=1 Tax=Gossypium arboreum TaxID=29729 RepID=A0A0B0NIA3_GOSAR|nr:hypothetical protein F383_15667 [Gossypium arboreum]
MTLNKRSSPYTCHTQNI